MKLKTTLLTALGALTIAAPAAVQAQDSDGRYYDQRPSYAYDEPADTGYYRRHVEHDRRGCHLARRPRYGVFLQRHNRLTIVCH
jgi:hypothetical protein